MLYALPGSTSSSRRSTHAVHSEWLGESVPHDSGPDISREFFTAKRASTIFFHCTRAQTNFSLSLYSCPDQLLSFIVLVPRPTFLFHCNRAQTNFSLSLYSCPDQLLSFITYQEHIWHHSEMDCSRETNFNNIEELFLDWNLESSAAMSRD